MASADCKRAAKLPPGKSMPPAQPVKAIAKKSACTEPTVKSDSITANSCKKLNLGGRLEKNGITGKGVSSALQPYKQRHNIGRRSAAERMGSYNEMELAECFPGVGSARYLSRSTDYISFKTDISESVKATLKNSDAEIQVADKSDRSRRNNSNSSQKDSLVEAAKRSDKATKGNSKKSTLDRNARLMNVETSGSKEGASIDRSVSTLSNEKKDENVYKIFPKKQVTRYNLSSLGPKVAPTKTMGKPHRKKAVSKSIITAKCSSSKGVVYDSEPEAPRGKRMARLNAEAIMSLMSEREEPLMSKKQPMDCHTLSNESESDIDSSTSSDSSDDESAQTFRRHLAVKKACNKKKTDFSIKSSLDSCDAQSSCKTGTGDVKSKHTAKLPNKNKVITKSELIVNTMTDETEIKCSKKTKKVKELEAETSVANTLPSPLPKRMASLNAQAILAASMDEKIKKPRLSGDSLNLVLQKPEVKSPGTNLNAAPDQGSKTTEKRVSDRNNSTSLSDRGVHANDTQSNLITASVIKTGPSVGYVSESSQAVPNVKALSASIPLKSSAVIDASASAHATVSHSAVGVTVPGRSPPKSHSKSSHARSRTVSDHSAPKSQQNQGKMDWTKHAGDVRIPSCSSDVTVGNFCRPAIGIAQSQALGFPVATRLTATVAPSPVRFNVPVIVPQPSVAGYLAAAARPSHHAYYPYGAGHNVFAYPVAGYPSTAHSYGSSTVASWSGLQDMSQFSYQPAIAAASLCSASAARGTGVMQQQHLQAQSHQQASQFFRPCFQPIAQAHQPQPYPNVQPAHSSLAVYPTRLGVVASADVILPTSHASGSSVARCYDPRSSTAIPSVGVLPVQSSTVAMTQFENSSTSSPFGKTKRLHSSNSSFARNDVSPVTAVTSQCPRESRGLPSTKEATSGSGSDSSSPIVKSYYVLGNDRRSGTVVTESTMVTASTLLQPFGIYAGCVSTPFNVTGMSPGQTSQGMHFGCFQPAGPVIQVPAFWDMQGFGQVSQFASAIKQVSAETTAAEKNPSGAVAHLSPNKSRGDSCTQTVGRNSATTSKGSGKKSRSKASADPNAASGKSVAPKKLETAVVTAMQMSVANQYQERELDLSQKSTTAPPATCSPTMEISTAGTGCRVPPAAHQPVKKLEDLSAGASKVSGMAMSQITNLERFVSEMVVDKVQVCSVAECSASVKPTQSHHSKRPSKRKLDMSGDGNVHENTDKISGLSKKAKLAVDRGETNQDYAESPLIVQSDGIPKTDEQQVLGSSRSVSVGSCVSSTKHVNGVLENQSVDPAAIIANGLQSAALSKHVLDSLVTDCSLSEVGHHATSVQTLVAIQDLSAEVKVSDVPSDVTASVCVGKAIRSPKVTLTNSDLENSESSKQITALEIGCAVSPDKQQSAAFSKMKSNTGCESGKKRRKDLTGPASRDRRTPTGNVAEVVTDEKLLKARNGEDWMRKMDKRDTGLWEWYGSGEMKLVHSKIDGAAVMRTCYPAVRHADGDVIHVRDCVLVKSGMRKKDIPYVAKIDKFWEDPDTGEMLMSILWYYRLEHTGTDSLPRYIDCEVFASRHRDIVPVACIEDRCYVLTLAEFSRYKAELRRWQSGCPPRTFAVPPSSPVSTNSQCQNLTNASRRLPDYTVDQETVFLCRQVYDVKLRRILKNPHVNVS